MTADLTQAAETVLSALPDHLAGLIIDHQPHKGNYETIEQYEHRRHAADDWVSPEERAKAIETDQLWTLQWYPNTPVGFHFLMASSLAALLSAKAKESGLPNPTEGG